MSFQNCKIEGVGVNPTDYLKHDVARGEPNFVVSSSSLRSFFCCPSKWREPIIAQDGTVSYWEFAGSKSTEWGDLFDCLLLTPTQFNGRFAVTPAVYDFVANICPDCGSESKAKKCKPCNREREPKLITREWSGQSDYCKKWKAEMEAIGKTCISRKDHYNVQQAIKRFMLDPVLGPFVEASEVQVWIKGEWKDEKTGLVIPVQCLVDIVPRADSEFAKCAGDVKTTVNARVIPWEKWCHAAGYDVQAAWNTDMLIAATNREILEFCFLLSENTAPWQTGRRMMTQDLPVSDSDQGDIAEGRRQYRAMMAVYCKCLTTGKWPGYDDTDESTQGWSVVSPNPYAAQARQFAPKFDFNEDPSEESEPSDNPESDNYKPTPYAD